MGMWLALVCALASPAHPIKANIKGSVEVTLVRAVPGEGAALAAQVARLLRWRGDIVRNVHPRDRIAVVYEQGPEGPELLALLFQGADIQLQGYRFTGADGVPRFFDQDGSLIEPVLLRPPTAYVQITELIQRGRGKRRHHGLDLKASQGTPVTLPFAATISRVNWSRRRNGNCVAAMYPDGHVALFLHLRTVARNVRPGARLPAGTHIGEVGSTGRSGAPHLHYEIRTASGKILDPLKVHGVTTMRLDEAQMARFRNRRHQLNALLGLEDPAEIPTTALECDRPAQDPLCRAADPSMTLRPGEADEP